MTPRHYDSRLLRDWWATIEERPDDRLLIGTFADFLHEREHPIALAMRWAFDSNRRPALLGEEWVWSFKGWHPALHQAPLFCWLPKWLMISKGETMKRWSCARYKSCTSAWQNFCRRFVARMPKVGRNAAFFCEAVP